MERQRRTVPSDNGQRTIGVVEDGVFYRSNWHSGRHLCRKYGAIGIDKGAFEQHIRPHAEAIEITDHDTGRIFRVTIADFEAHCIEGNLGWGEQLFLPLRYFTQEPVNSEGLGHPGGPL